MTVTAITVRYLWRQAAWMLFLVACDSFTPEPPDQIKFSTDYYTLPGSSIVIDMKSVIEQSFASVSLSISQDPLRGTLTELDPFLLKYTPGPDFKEGTDQFVLSVVFDNSTNRSQVMNIFMKEKTSDFRCGLYAIEDDVRLNEKETVAANPVTNDYICDINGPMDLFIHIMPKFGDAIISGDSIMYTPGPSFSFSDELVYGLSTTGSDDIVYGIVSFNKMRVETLPISFGLSDIFFVNDSMGFATGGSLILKTTNGGENWSGLSYPGEEQFEPLKFQEIFFLDKDVGYVAFSSCEYGNDPDCLGGWIETKDGGQSWKRIDLDRPVNSVFFVSRSVGFISTSKIDFWDFNLETKVQKTVNGGETWEEVFSSTSYFGVLKVRFASDMIGYAFQLEEIFGTTDGGRTWNQAAANRYVVSLAVTRENVICASFNASLSETTPSTIVRSDGGATWTPVIDFPYSILAQEFSPSGNLGVAAGISEKKLVGADVVSVVAIAKTTDKGKTWTTLGKSVEVNGLPIAISVPSENVAYILCSGKLIKYSH